MFGWLKKLEESFFEKYTFNKVAIIFYAGLSFLFGSVRVAPSLRVLLNEKFYN